MPGEVCSEWIKFYCTVAQKHSVSRVWWENLISYADVRRRVQPLEQPPSSNRWRWLGHVLRIPTNRLPRPTPFAKAGNEGWRMGQDVQLRIWWKVMKTMINEISLVDQIRWSDWSPRDPLTRWLITRRYGPNAAVSDVQVPKVFMPVYSAFGLWFHDLPPVFGNAT